MPWGSLGLARGDVLAHLSSFANQTTTRFKPDGGEVAPSEFPDDGVSSVGKGITNMDGVIPTLNIIFPVLLVLCDDRNEYKACDIICTDFVSVCLEITVCYGH